MPDLSLSNTIPFKWTVMINPVSGEQADGLKKVKAVLSGLIMAFIFSPHEKMVSVLKLHVESKPVSLPSQVEQKGNEKPTRGPGSSTNVESSFVSPS